MTLKERYSAFINHFIREKAVTTELHYENGFQLLVAVILSAQCTDKRVNKTTPLLFQNFPTVADLANSNTSTLYLYISSISYPNNKTKYLIGMAQMVMSEFKGVIPQHVSDLQKLPGVGRKTAHVIASVLYNQPKMAVDTHVFRVSKRIGLVNDKAKTPLAVEKQLVKHLPKSHIAQAHHWLILHGRYTCLARKPKCTSCKLTSLCQFFAQQQSDSISKLEG